MLLDVDHFKAYNDYYGHQAGDRCLEQVTLALLSCCQRLTDFAARYDGEKFAFILPETDLPGAIRVADAALSAVSHLNIPHAKPSTGVGVSIRREFRLWTFIPTSTSMNCLRPQIDHFAK